MQREKLYTFDDIISWYKVNCDTAPTLSVLDTMSQRGMIRCEAKGLYTLRSINDALLEKFNGEYVIDDNGKFKVKEQRKAMIKATQEQQQQPKPNNSTTAVIAPKKPTTRKFKLELGKGNKMRLVNVD